MMFNPKNLTEEEKKTLGEIRWQLLLADQASHPDKEVPHLRKALSSLLVILFGSGWDHVR